MNNGDFDAFRSMLVGLSQIYDKDITKATGEIYWNALKQFPIDLVQYAINAHVNNPESGMYFPKPADLIKHLVATEKQLTLESNDRAELSWNVIIGEISRIGSYGTLKLEDGQAMAAVKAIGGWMALCMMPTDKHTWAKKEFIAAYNTYERTPTELLPNKLPGRIAIHNHKIKQQQGAIGMKQVLEKLSLKKDK